MPKNSDAHATRLAKVTQGFKAAKLDTEQINRIIGVFDSLSETMAREVAQRTEFSVSSRSKAAESLWGSGRAEDRRQMARAFMFVDDLLYLYDEKPLPKKLTDQEFETVWRGDAAAIESSLKQRAKALCDVDIKYREILTKPVVAGPRPAPKKLNVPKELAALLEGNLKTQNLRALEVRRGQTSLLSLKTAWSDSKTGLVAAFAVQVNSSLSNMTSVQVAGTNAYKEFEAFFREAGKETEAKLGLAKSFFSALESFAPFPFSIVGKVGVAAVGALHVDTVVRQERVLGSPKYFDSNIPVLATFNSKLGEVKNWASDLTRLGVDGSSLPSGTSISDAIDAAKARTVKLLNARFLEAINETYGATPAEQADKGTVFYQKVLEGLGGASAKPREELVAQMAVNKATQLFNATKEAIQGGTGALRVVSSEVIQPFIELQLMAEYMASLIPEDTTDYGKSVPDALIRRLESAPHEILVRKTSKGQAQQIFAAKKLPWTDGHPRHVAGVAFFFRWYKKNVNPFDIATGKVTPEGIRTAMEAAIVEIGTSLQTHRVNRTLRVDIANWSEVAKDVARIRGV